MDDVEPRYRVIAYVDNAGNAQRCQDEGTTTYQKIFSNSPDAARYAIVLCSYGRYRVFDMWEFTMQVDFDIDPTDEELASEGYETGDAAIAATVMSSETTMSLAFRRKTTLVRAVREHLLRNPWLIK